MKKTLKSKAAVLTYLTTAPAPLPIDEFMENLTLQLDTNEKLTEFMRGLDLAFQDEERTMVMAKYLVNELRKSYERDGETFNLAVFD